MKALPLVLPRSDDDAHPLRGWEERVIEAVGAVIGYWGFKHNQGRVWALLYLRGEPYCAAEIQEVLGLSKGAVSMLVRELEGWDVIRRVRISGSPAMHFVANADFIPMIGRVLGSRERVLFERVKHEIEEAEREAQSDPDVDRATLDRLRRMRSLATLMDQVIEMFMSSARLDLRRVVALLARLRREREEL